MKKITRIEMFIFAVTILISTTSAYADVVQPIKEMQIGDYFILGKYNDEPIVWRYMADDENGKLIVSDKILCLKPYGINNYWKDSFIRKWLNSTEYEDKANWEPYISNWAMKEININEKGFLNESNFNSREKNVIKDVTQWSMLPQNHLELTENDSSVAYTGIKVIIKGKPQDGGKTIYYDVSELPNVYNGAAQKATDKIFLLDEMQIYNIWKNFGDLRAICSKKCVRHSNDYNGQYYRYLLRTNNICVNLDGSYYIYTDTIDGIRPAFYLDEDNAVILSGSGTAEEPYIMTGREIEVYTNGTKAEMSDQPTIKDGIVMLPVKETFEKLGAKVNWDEATQAVTIEKDGNYIYMLKDNKGIMINGEIYDLGYPMTMIDDVAYVPLTAIEMTITPNVTWNGEQYQIDINTKLS